MSQKLGGILAAVSTPFAADGTVDEAALRRHVDFLIDNGLHGLVPGGSTGEFAALTSDERKFVNKVVIDQGSVGSSGVVPLMSLNELLRSSAAPAAQQGGVK